MTDETAPAAPAAEVPASETARTATLTRLLYSGPVDVLELLDPDDTAGEPLFAGSVHPGRVYPLPAEDPQVLVLKDRGFLSPASPASPEDAAAAPPAAAPVAPAAAPAGIEAPRAQVPPDTVDPRPAPDGSGPPGAGTLVTTDRAAQRRPRNPE